MKNLGILTLVLMFFISSCSTTQKAAKDKEIAFRGTWTLDQVVSDQANKVVITKLLDHESVECFEGGTWHLVANNNSGYYKLEGPNCAPNEFDIKWYMENDGSDTYFWFKRVTDDVKAKNVVSGYKMKVISITDTNAHMMHEVPFEGGKLALHYYFSKQ
ncbi:MAG: lipocalin family protein [Flavobacteriaceae bacterium]|nr:lipocalin family protein [Flavobacteriaceae bacterium]